MFLGNAGKNNGNIFNVNIPGDQNDLQIGDITTNALKRAENALIQVNSEIHDNFRNLSGLIGSMDELKPEVFWDIRRVNETEEMYQVRAAAEFQKYISHMNVIITSNNLTKNVHLSFLRELSHFSDISEKIKSIYHYFDEALYHIKKLVEKYSLLTFTSENNKTLIRQGLLYHREEIAAAKMNLLNAVAKYCLVIDDPTDARIVSEAIELAEVKLQVEPGKNGYKSAMKLAVNYSQERVAALSDQCGQFKAKRTVGKKISDPLLIKLREKVSEIQGLNGLKVEKNILSEAEIKHLELKELDSDETDPAKLFSKAQFSFFESDGEACVFYFERALKLSSLPPRPRKFAELTLHRLKNPEIYEGNIGVMVYDILSGGSFEKAGIKFGDVIISVNEIPVYEPMDISSILAKSGSDPVVIKIIREGKSTRVIVEAGKPAAAVLTQLICLNIFQF